MSLKSSEINNCSWIISAVLESPFYSSSCCQTCCPAIVRPMNRLWELILKIFLHSQEMNRSVEWRRRLNDFLRYLVFGEREYFPGSMSIQFLLSMGTILGEEPAGSLLCGFAFAFDRHAKPFALSFDACSSSWFSWISVSLLFKFITMRNSDPRVSIVSIQRPNSDLNSMFTVQITGCNFQYGPNFGVSLDPTFWFVMLLLLLEECIHDKPLHEIVRDLQCLSLWNTVHSQQHSEILHTYMNLPNLSCCDSFSIRSSSCWNRKFWFAGSSLSKGTSVLITLSTIDCPMTTSLPVLSWRDSYSSHISANAP